MTPVAQPTRALLEAFFDGPINARLDDRLDARWAARLDAHFAARSGGFGLFGSLQFSGLGRELCAAQRGIGRPRLVGVYHVLGSRVRIRSERRYAQMRQRNEPHFKWKSLYLVFGSQALLAWLVAMPFLAAAAAPDAATAMAWSGLHSLGLVVALSGLVFEGLADAQMATFKAKAPKADEVMNQGLWRYSRHPNYFGESCLWWGIAVLALAGGGAWWALLSPVLVTFLPLTVSGVNLQEPHLQSRGPTYVEYVRRTSAFVPIWPKVKAAL